MSSPDDFEWNVLYESRLLDAMHGHKPVGVNKYFQMAFICDKFTDNINKDINPDKIWAHLGTMYNLEALDESESIPFPNNEKDFHLPETEFGPLIIKKEEDKKSQQKVNKEPPKVNKEVKNEDKTSQNRNTKEAQRRDSKDSRDSGKSTPSFKKEIKKEKEKDKEQDKVKSSKGRSGSGPNKEKDREEGSKQKKNDENSKHNKRPTRGSLKPEDSSSSGKSSPVSTTPGPKRRRI